MKISSVPLAVSLVCALAVTAAHAQTAESPLQFERGFPTAGTAEKAHDASDLRRAIEAYKFFYPTTQVSQLRDSWPSARKPPRSQFVSVI